MNNQDIRWQQRFRNFEKAFIFLDTSLKKENVTPLEKAGIIQAFEFTFELAWKTLKDYLEENNVIAPFPRDVIKEAFRHELLTEGEIWMDMLEKRNLMAHTYDDDVSEFAVRLIREKYFRTMEYVYKWMKSKNI